jgi:hypothetical protein
LVDRFHAASFFSKKRPQRLGLVRQLQPHESLVHGVVIRGQFDQDRAQGFGVELPNERGQVIRGSLARHWIDCRF